MNDPEHKAIGEITKALGDLSEDQRRNVLIYVNARYGGQLQPHSRAKTATESESPARGVGKYDDIGDFFDSANPQTESEKVLIVAYWVQVVEGAADFESFPVNQQLKNLGHPVSNITRALDTMIKQSPRLIIQTSKSGRAKQARKRYKITREGIKRVQATIAQLKGDRNDN